MHGIVMKALQKNRSGFTLAEVLIVVAILGVLVAVGVPMFGAQRERANIAVDQATMRTAYSHLIAESLTGGIQADGTPYFYDAATQTFTTERPAGYGKSKTDAKQWWSGVGTASGAPNNGSPTPLQLALASDGTVEFCWGSNTYAGLNVTSREVYTSLSPEEKVDRDLILIDSLQSQVRGLTYGELRDMFYDATLGGGYTLKSQYAESSYQPRVQQLDGKLCITLAEGTINAKNNSFDVNSDKTAILATELFNAVGYDTNLSSDSQYIVNSIAGAEYSRIWLNLRVTQKELLDPKNADKVASNAYTYVKGRKNGDTAECLREINRRTY